MAAQVPATDKATPQQTPCSVRSQRKWHPGPLGREYADPTAQEALEPAPPGPRQIQEPLSRLDLLEKATTWRVPPSSQAVVPDAKRLHLCRPIRLLAWFTDATPTLALRLGFAHRGAALKFRKVLPQQDHAFKDLVGVDLPRASELTHCDRAFPAN